MSTYRDDDPIQSHHDKLLATYCDTLKQWGESVGCISSHATPPPSTPPPSKVGVDPHQELPIPIPMPSLVELSQAVEHTLFCDIELPKRKGAYDLVRVVKGLDHPYPEEVPVWRGAAQAAMECNVLITHLTACIKAGETRLAADMATVKDLLFDCAVQERSLNSSPTSGRGSVSIGILDIPGTPSAPACVHRGDNRNSSRSASVEPGRVIAVPPSPTSIQPPLHARARARVDQGRMRIQPGGVGGRMAKSPLHVRYIEDRLTSERIRGIYCHSLCIVDDIFRMAALPVRMMTTMLGGGIEIGETMETDDGGINRVATSTTAATITSTVRSRVVLPRLGDATTVGLGTGPGTQVAVESDDVRTRVAVTEAVERYLNILYDSLLCMHPTHTDINTYAYCGSGGSDGIPCVEPTIARSSPSTLLALVAALDDRRRSVDRYTAQHLLHDLQQLIQVQHQRHGGSTRPRETASSTNTLMSTAGRCVAALHSIVSAASGCLQARQESAVVLVARTQERIFGEDMLRQEWMSTAPFRRGKKISFGTVALILHLRSNIYSVANIFLGTREPSLPPLSLSEPAINHHNPLPTTTVATGSPLPVGRPLVELPPVSDEEQFGLSLICGEIHTATVMAMDVFRIRFDQLRADLGCLLLHSARLLQWAVQRTRPINNTACPSSDPMTAISSRNNVTNTTRLLTQCVVYLFFKTATASSSLSVLAERRRTLTTAGAGETSVYVCASNVPVDGGGDDNNSISEPTVYTLLAVLCGKDEAACNTPCENTDGSGDDGAATWAASEGLQHEMKLLLLTRGGGGSNSNSGGLPVESTAWSAEYITARLLRRQSVCVDGDWLCAAIAGRYEMLGEEDTGYPRLTEDQLESRQAFKIILSDIRQEMREVLPSPRIGTDASDARVIYCWT